MGLSLLDTCLLLFLHPKKVLAHALQLRAYISYEEASVSWYHNSVQSIYIQINWWAIYNIKINLKLTPTPNVFSINFWGKVSLKYFRDDQYWWNVNPSSDPLWTSCFIRMRSELRGSFSSNCSPIIQSINLRRFSNPVGPDVVKGSADRSKVWLFAMAWFIL